MPIESLLERIRTQGEEEARKILDEARAQAEKIREKGRTEAEALRKELEREATRRAQAEKERLLSQARLESRLKVLSSRQEIVRGVFDTARERLSSLDKEKKVRFFGSLLDKARPDGNEEIVPAKSERGFFTPEVLDSLNKALGEKGRLTLAKEDASIPNGFVLRKGNRSDVCTIESALEQARDGIEPHIVKILFGSLGR